MTDRSNELNEMQELGNNNEDQLEDNHNRPQLGFEEAMQMFCSGFGECAREAIRYLIEDEGIPANHPFVVGLKQHLVLRETYFLLQCLNYPTNQSLPSYEQAMQQRLHQTISQDSGYASPSSRPISPSIRSDNN